MNYHQHKLKQTQIDTVLNILTPTIACIVFSGFNKPWLWNKNRYSISGLNMCGVLTMKNVFPFQRLGRSFWLFLGPLLFFILGCGNSNLKNKEDESSYFGPHAQEFKFSFKSEILVPMSEGEPSDESVQDDVRLAAKYILGRMHQDGSIYPAMKIKLIKFEVDAKNPEYYRVSYSLSGRAVLPKILKQYTFYVPLMPRKIYKKASTSGPCHHKDDDAVDGNNFWYQWDPEIPGCSLKHKIDYLKETVQLFPVNTPPKTYPEFDRLVRNKTLSMTLFFGASSKNNTDWNPQSSSDLGARSYIAMQYFLRNEMGFTISPFPEAEIRKIYNPKNPNMLPQGQIATLQTSRGLIRIRMLFVESHLGDSRASAFHYFLKEALKNESVIFYEGHSGIGSNLHLDRIEKEHDFKMTFGPQYQIIFFGSCLPYGYYPQMYFDRKMNVDDPKGTKNLDIIAYAKESHFGNVESMQVIRILTTAMKIGIRFSYQDMIFPTSKDFFGVIGDEDNPTIDKPF